MAGSRLPLVSGDRLLLSERADEQQAAIIVGSDAWYLWLTSEEARSFTFKCSFGTFTARRERKRNGWYWYMYRKQQGRLHKAYLGRSQEISLTRLTSRAETLLGSRSNNGYVAPASEEKSVAFATPSREDGRHAFLPQQTFPLSFSGEGEKVKKHNLPVQSTPLVGRVQDVEVICSLLRQPEVHLLTLTGIGGIGKTRLGLQVAAELLGDYDDGVYFVPLAPVRDPELVMSTIAQTLGIKETVGQAILSHLKVFLQDRHLLLLLDNFEQILSAAPGLSDLLVACPHLKVLVTSRAPLHISGEYEFLVQPLAVPSLKQLPEVEMLSQYAAVALFLQRARMIKPDFQVTPSNARFIAEICVRLDGLPLAIELAAARSKLLSPQALLSRLEHRLAVLTAGEKDAPVRQQTLRNTLSWSYELLDKDEQWLFRHLAIFVGGCQLSAAEKLCAALGDLATPVLDVAASLVDKNLLQVTAQEDDEPRLMMLETVREYGLECLEAAGELERAREAHASTYFSFMMRADSALVGVERETWPMWHDREQERWLDWEQRDYANLRAALYVLLECGAPENALQFAVGLANLWFFRGYASSEGRSILERVLSAKGMDKTTCKAKGWTLYLAGWLAFYQSDERQAMVSLEASERLFRGLGYTRGVAACLTVLGNIEHHRGNLKAGDAMLEESLALYRETEDRVGIGYALLTQGILAFFRGEFKRTRILCEESLVFSKEMGHTWLIATNLHYLGWALFLQGAYADAYRLSQESVALFKELGHAGFAVEAQIVLAHEVSALGDEASAYALLEEAQAQARAMESQDDIARALCGLGRLALRRGDLSHAQNLYEEAVMILKQEAEIPDRVQWVLASCLEGIGEIALGRGLAAWAVRLFARAAALRTGDGHRNMIGIEQPLYERLLAEATARLGKETFAVLWAEGCRMTTEQVLVAQGREEAPSDTLFPAFPLLPIPLAAPPAGLTRREFEVLHLVVKGLTNAQIAERLVISLTTVNSYLSSIYRKLGVSSRLAAMRYVIDHQLF
ncbi:MAG TPA: LuxR C-terminal-related transcriptional regulator [Ktedonobacteraceae bacterium]|nr:LuxR C-terminal-related transcriptional regulator [Ktedonobacteraceae bacterium]